MKKTNQCPKCGSADIAQFQSSSSLSGVGLNLQLSPGVANVTRYVCKKCGFIESWVADPRSLSKLQKKSSGDR